MMTDDMALVREFAASQSERAFEQLVARHVNMVYSSAWRRVGDAHLAEEITQAVFIILARKAGSLGAKTILSGWLYHTTRFAAGDVLKIQRRRQRREQEAYMRSTLTEPQSSDAWQQIAPLLEAAMDSLGERDRNAVVLRYLDGKSLGEVGASLGVSEDAAKMRVNRALEKLRKIFSKRGVTLTAALIAGAVSANSVQAAPIGLAVAVTAATAKGAVVSGSTLIIIKGALKIMAWTKVKTAIVVGVGVLLAAGTAKIAIKEIEESQTYPWQVQDPDYKLLAQAPSLLKILPTKFPNRSTSIGSSDGHDVKRIGISVTVETMIHGAYGFWRSDRMIRLTPLPQSKYDFIVSLPKGSNEALKQAIKEKFGIVARRETRETDASLLVIKNSSAPGLKPSAATSSGNNDSNGGLHSGEYSYVAGTLSDIAGFCEGKLEIPVLDRTGITNKYDIDLKWQWQEGSSEKEAFTKAVLDQLGLELVPSHEPIEMLIIEKVK